jgi:hypothetical protein
LPQELHDALARATRNLDSQSLPLVRHETQLLSAEQPALPSSPPERRASFAACGALVGALLAALGLVAARFRAARALFGGITALFGAALGILGVALAAFSASKHWAAHDNPSLLACPPWALALAVLGVTFALSRGKSRALLGVLAASLLASLLLTLLALAGVLGGDREALREGLLFTPVWAGWLVGAWLAQRHVPGAALKP